MHYYNQQSDQIAAMRDRIKELEEINASTELALDVAWDELEECQGREQRLLWTALCLGTVAMIAIMKLSWMAVEK